MINPAPAYADSATPLDRLPWYAEEVPFAEAVWDGAHAYVFGYSRDVARYDPRTRVATLVHQTNEVVDPFTAVFHAGYAYVLTFTGRIIRYDPAENESRFMASTLPDVGGPTTVSDGRYIYLFGGHFTDETGTSDLIFRFDPVSDMLVTLQARLPSTRRWMSATFDGRFIYLFGGLHRPGTCCSQTDLDEILRFDPLTGELEVLAVGLPTPLYATTAVFDGRVAYIMGGLCSYGTPGCNQGPGTSRDFLRFDPETETIVTLPERLFMFAELKDHPYATILSAIWDGSNVRIFGDLNYIHHYDPSTDRVERYGMLASISLTDAVWNGTHAYVFGGAGTMFGGSIADASRGYAWGTSSRIVRYDLDAREVSVMPALLPTGLAGISAVWDGRERPNAGCPEGCFYVFGGECSSDRDDGCLLYYDRIMRYDPAGQAVTLMNARLPTGRAYTSAVWDGNDAYIFGGVQRTRPYFLTEILRYNPDTDAITTMEGRLPVRTAGSSAVWTGTHAYVLGGYQGNVLVGSTDGTPVAEDQARVCLSTSVPPWPAPTWPRPTCPWFNDVLRYDPGSDTVTRMRAPVGRAYGAAVWDGRNAVYFGGVDHEWRQRSEILLYDPQADRTTVMRARLPDRTFKYPNGEGRCCMSAVWNGREFTLFGGLQWCRLEHSFRCDDPLPDLAIYDVTPEAVVDLSGSPGAQVGEATLTWQPPPRATYSWIRAYRVYRLDDRGVEVLVAEVQGETVTWTDTEVAPGEVRTYRVSAVGSGGTESPLSAAVTAVGAVPRAPEAPALEARSAPSWGAVRLSWQVPPGNGGPRVGGYRIYRATARDAQKELLATVGPVLTYDDVGCPAGSPCFYEVTAVNDVGEGLPSNEATALGSSLCEIACLPGAPVEALLVDSRDPDPQLTRPLASGVSYQVKVSGRYLFYYPNPILEADAGCSTVDGTTWAADRLEPGVLTLEIDGALVAWEPIPGTAWDDRRCSPVHEYRTTIIGEGRPVGLRILDREHNDNAGALLVAIIPG